MEKALKETQVEAAKALATGSTREEAARAAGVHERTVYKWLEKAEFEQAVREARDAYWEATLSGLRTAALMAVRYLHDVVSGSVEGDGHRVKAAATLLNASLNLARWQEMRDLEERVIQLEGVLYLSNGHRATSETSRPA